MALMTKEQYLSSLRGLGHRVFIQRAKVESVPDHPISKPPAMAMAETYQQAEQEDREYAFPFAVPADTRGVTFIYGRQPSDTRRLKDGRAACRAFCGTPQGQKIMITRLADIESAKSCAYKLCGL